MLLLFLFHAIIHSAAIALVSWFGVVSNLGYEKDRNNLVSVKPMIGYVGPGFESALPNTVKISKDANLIN